MVMRLRDDAAEFEKSPGNQHIGVGLMAIEHPKESGLRGLVRSAWLRFFGDVSKASVERADIEIDTVQTTRTGR